MGLIKSSLVFDYKTNIMVGKAQIHKVYTHTHTHTL